MKYVDLAIDNRSDRTDMLYTYGCEDDSIGIGSKVCVKFANRKTPVTGYVFGISDERPEGIEKLRYVEEIDTEVSLTEESVRTAAWMRKRYLTRYIDAVGLFTPAGEALKSGGLRQVLPDDADGREAEAAPELTDEQKEAVRQIAADEGHGIYLIHGVTGSGKTEIYMRLIEKAIEDGKGAVMLVPEISLTTQVTGRFIKRFGAEKIAILHSRLSPGERHDEWMRIRNGDAKIVIGARSAVFCPMENIGIIIMDEEHEATYKSEKTPKYETVEVAVKRAMDHGAKVVLGSATPSVISYRRSEEGIYKRIELKRRYNMNEMPAVSIIDMREQLRSGSSDIISQPLEQAVREELDRKKQVILFLNRRGYSSFVSCRTCGSARKCPDCGISMTYHKAENMLRCHYCGRREAVPETCPDCGSEDIGFFGTGTEKVDERVRKMFPGSKVARLDLDTMRKKGSADRIISDFENEKTDILIGTQVVAKGLDFRNVGLVGILSADISLNIPDFRSAERTFQLITQAAGRAGRGTEPGRVLIQTYTPDNYAVQAAKDHDYEAFYSKEIVFRQMRRQPPFSDFIQVVFQSTDSDLPPFTAAAWEHRIKQVLGSDEEVVMMRGPMIVANRKEGTKECLLLRCPRGGRSRFFSGLASMKEETMRREGRIHITVDVNPYSIWRG